MPTYINPEHMTLSQALELQQYDSAAKFVKSVEKKSVLTQLLPWFPTSHGDLHKGVKAASLPSGSFGAINKAIAGGNASTVAYQETVKVFELKNTIDRRLLEGRKPEDAAKIREARDRMFGLGFMQSFAENLATCGGTSADEVKGLLPRRNKLDADLCISAGGTGANLGSILFIKPGEDGVCLRYPGNAGVPNFKQEDMGLQKVDQVENGVVLGSYYAYETLWQLYYLLDVFDDKAMIRLANIPTTTAMTSAMVNNVIDIAATLPGNGEGYFAIAPKKVIAQFQKYCLDKNNIAFSYNEVQGMGRPMHIFNIPLFAEEYMPTNETVIS